MHYGNNENFDPSCLAKTTSSLIKNISASPASSIVTCWKVFKARAESSSLKDDQQFIIVHIAALFLINEGVETARIMGIFITSLLHYGFLKVWIFPQGKKREKRWKIVKETPRHIKSWYLKPECYLLLFFCYVSRVH